MMDQGTLLKAAVLVEESDKHWLSLFDDEDQELASYFRLMMIRLYRYHRLNRPMYKMQACWYIPRRHAAAARKYIERAEKRGWVTFVPDESDKRKTIVKPSDDLINLIEKHLTCIVDTASEFSPETRVA